MNIMTLEAVLSLNSKLYEDGLKSAESQASSFSGTLSNGLKTAGKVAARVLEAATAAVTAFAGSAVKVGAQFDSSMSQVAATLGYSVEELKDSTSEASQNLVMLRDFAMEMGSKTAFSASQAADALNYMALAGYDAETSIATLPTVLNLAAAGGLELATASDMVTDAQTALGLELPETLVMVDQMAMAASKTNTSVGQLGDAILTVGGTARFMADGTDELTSVLGVLADNGIKGSEAGTHLRNMLLSLSSPTDNAMAQMEALGLQVFDSEGKMRSFSEIFPELNASMSELTEQEKLDALSTIFNSRDIASATALLETDVERWSELSGYLNEAGNSAKSMADTQLDNLNGDITIFKSALEGAQIILSDELTPGIRNFVQFGTKGISNLSNAFKSGGLSGAMGEFGKLLTEGLNKIVKGLPKVVESGKELLTALISGIRDNVPVILEAALEVLQIFGEMIVENLPVILQTGLEIITALILGITDALPALIPQLVNLVFNIADALLSNLQPLLDAGLELIMALATGLLDALPSLLDKLPELILGILNFIYANIPQIINAGVDLLTALVDNLPVIIDKIVEVLPDLIIGIVDAIIDSIPMLVSAGVRLLVSIVKDLPTIIVEVNKGILKLLKAMVEKIIEYFPTLKEKGVELLGKVGEGIMSAVNKAKEWGKDLIDNFIQGIKDKIAALKDTVSNVAGTIKSFLGFSEPEAGPLSNFHTYAPDMMELFAKGIRDNEDLVRNQLSKSFDFGEFYSGEMEPSAMASGNSNINLTEAIKDALDSYEIRWNDRNLGRLVRTYA